MDEKKIFSVMQNDRHRNAKLSVTNTSSALVSPYIAGETRKVIALTNASTGGQIITLSWGNQAVANQGIVLQPGQSWVESIDSFYIPSNQDIWAISSAVGGILAIQERIIAELR